MEESLTSGRISIVVAPEVADLVAREAAAFRALYPKANVQIQNGSSRAAIDALFAATCDIAAITRELRPDERRAALQGGLGLEGYRFARDALVMIANPSNPVENVTIQDVRRIYRGEVKNWAELNGANAPVVPVFRPAESDIAEFFVEEVLGGELGQARVVYEDTDSAVVGRVRHDPNAIGFVSLGSKVDGVRVLRASSLQGLPYWKPDLEAVYKGEYPLTRYFNFYVRAERPRLANGFITFVTSYDGQKLVREAGLVPTAVPVRFVRRSPMLSGHK